MVAQSSTASLARTVGLDPLLHGADPHFGDTARHRTPCPWSPVASAESTVGGKWGKASCLWRFVLVRRMCFFCKWSKYLVAIRHQPPSLSPYDFAGGEKAQSLFGEMTLELLATACRPSPEGSLSLHAGPIGDLLCATLLVHSLPFHITVSLLR